MSEKILYLHAGSHKTGSSALQNFFENNVNQLESLGFSYENRNNIETKYQITCGNGPLLYSTLEDPYKSDNEIDSLLLEYFGQRDKAICSNECFTALQETNWKKLFESLKRLNIQLKIIVYVRNIIPFLLSAYDQVIKEGDEHREFNEWVLQDGIAHVIAPILLKTIADHLPKSNIFVLHYDREETRLIKSFLSVIGIEHLFKIDSIDQHRRVNRSLTTNERKALLNINKVLGFGYSKELSDMLLYANPEIPVVFESCDKKTEEFLIDFYKNDVNWINNEFFNGQSVLSVLPIEAERKKINQASEIEPITDILIDKLILNWALEKIKFAKLESERSLIDKLRVVAMQGALKNNQSDIPIDFDPLAYLLLNYDLIRAGVDPIKHYIENGKSEDRKYKF